jgi:sirohydrochlorin ferrochelatase
MPPPFNADEGILLLGHGSPDVAAMAEAHRFADYFRRQSGSAHIHLAFLEAEPSIPTALNQMAAQGVRKVRACPLFLFPGKHVLSDLPTLCRQAEAQHPQMKILLSEALIFHPKMVELAYSRIVTPRPRLDGTHPQRTALLVVGRGATEPRMMLAMEAFVEQLKVGLPFGHCLHCFVEVSPPFMPAGLNRCLDLGVTTIVIFPFVLFSGIVYQKILKQAALMRERYADMVIRTTDYIGLHPLLCEMVTDGLQNAKPLGH